MATNTTPRTSPDTDESTQSTADRTDEAALPTLAEVLDRVASQGPQIITRGDDRFVVLEAQEIEIKEDEPNFIEFLLNGPRFDGVEIEHEPWEMREVEL